MSADCVELEESAPPWHGPYALRAFRHRNYTLLYFGQLISLSGTWLQGLSLPYVTFTLTGSKLLLGIVAAAGMLPSLIITLPSGVIADRFSKRRIVIITQILLMMQALTLAVLTFTHSLQVWHIIALAAFAGFASAMDLPTRQAMIVELVGKEDLANAIALNSTMFNLTRIASPFVGGVVLALVGPAWCFMVNAFSYLGAIIGLLMMRNVRARKQASKDESMTAQILEGFGHVWDNKLTRTMLILQSVSTLMIGQYVIFFPVYALKIYEVGAMGQGAMTAAVGLGALAAAMIVSSLGHRYQLKDIVIVGGVLAPLGLIGLALCGSFYASLACLVVVGIGMMSFTASANTIMQMEAPDSLVGRVMSVRALVLFGLGAPGAVMLGRLSELKYIGVSGTLLICSTVALAATIYFSLTLAKSKQADSQSNIRAASVIEKSTD
ncbi:MAG: MFS transporter [Armatimonadetes bacterium]|nr:MFS transporter [Armatimonadota bacterium]